MSGGFRKVSGAERVGAPVYRCPWATSASAERLFSIAGRNFDDLRQKMGAEMLEMLMWARVNCEKRHNRT